MRGKKVFLMVEPHKAPMDRAFSVLKKPSKRWAGFAIISFPDFETLGRAITGARLELLSVIRTKTPKSIQELARLVGRDFKNVHRDVNLLAEFGLIELRAAAPNGKTPISKYSELIVAT